MTDFPRLIFSSPLNEITEKYPVSRDFFRNLNLPGLDASLPLADALALIDAGWLEEFGLTAEEIPVQLADFLERMTAREGFGAIRSLTIIGGEDKSGGAENITLTLKPGDIVSIVGPTGSGKSRLLADIECLAQGDTPTKRRVLIDGAEVSDDRRFGLGGKIIAQLSQNMNFVMELSVGEFLSMHAGARMLTNAEALAGECFKKANELAGEKFQESTKVTELSGGQSRALMIADCAYISDSVVVLIDEIENAGVDRRRALALLSGSEKIVLISTHDPLLALSAPRRVVIRGGGIYKILDTDENERASLAELERIDKIQAAAREALRSGERLGG